MSLFTGSTVQLGYSGIINEIVNLGLAINPTLPATLSALNQTFQLGSGAQQVNWASLGVRSVTSGTPDLVDLTTTLKSPGGVTCNFADIMALVIVNPAGSAGNLQVGDAASNAWSAFLGATGVMTVLPGFTNFLIGNVAAGYTVDGTHKVLQVAASAGTISYTILAAGH